VVSVALTLIIDGSGDDDGKMSGCRFDDLGTTW
jgi:hypothetical protein